MERQISYNRSIKVKFNYNQSDFVEKNYKRILKKINSKTIFYDQTKVNSEFTLWRHDIDFSIHRSYSLAKIEKKKNIKATYFLLLGSKFYNLFEQEIHNLIIKIVSLGHQLGLHFDCSQYEIKNKKELEQYLTYEKKILENLFQVKIKVFSFHNPTKKVLRFDNFKYAKMINTYAKYFKKNVQYCSDSNGYWRHERLENFLNKKYHKIQVLTHPGWWQIKSMSPFKRIIRCVNGRAKKVITDYTQGLKKHGRKNVK
jgi:hypothetical protein